MNLDSMPRVCLAHLPTPLEEAPTLASEIGLSSLLVKRDDQTGLALGGNKARKLEYLMADAAKQGCDVVLTDGGPQSNHARMTAAAARKLGLDVKLVLGGPDFQTFQGNLLLDILLDAEIRFLKDKDVPEMEVELQDWADELREEGRRPYVVPIGGSTPVGALGYVRAMHELREQLGDEPAQIVLAVGSCGTFAGATLGARLFLPSAEVIGVSVSRGAGSVQHRAAEIANASSDLLGASQTFEPDDFRVDDQHIGQAYGIPTQAGNQAIVMCARLEGLLLDPVYTGKAMSGLIDLARSAAIDPSRPVVFLHTGGIAALFAYEGEFQSLARSTKR